MNIGKVAKDKRYSKYICDKCGKEIPFIGQKGFVGIMHYCSKGQRDGNYKHDFDLCKSCEKKFREWLKEKPIPTKEDLIEKFPIWKEDNQ